MNIIESLYACAAEAHHSAWCDATDKYYDGTTAEMIEADKRREHLERWSGYANQRYAPLENALMEAFGKAA